MTIAVTNIGTAQGASSAAITVPAGGVPLGAVIILGISAAAVSAPSDTGGNTYTLIATVNSPSATLSVFRATVTTALVSGNTVNTGSVTGPTASAVYISGSQSVPDGAVTASASGTSAAPSVTSGTPGASNEMFLGFVDVDSSAAITQASGWTAPPNSISRSTTRQIFGGNLLNTGTGSETYNPTTVASHGWAAIILAFAPSGSVFNQTVSATNSAVAILARQTGLSRVSVNNAVASLVRSIGAARLATNAALASLARQTKKTDLAVNSAHALLSRQTAKSLAAASHSVASLVTARIFPVALLAIDNAVATLVRKTGKVLLATDSAVASLSRAVTLSRLAVNSSVALLTKRTTRTLESVNAAVALLAKAKTTALSLLARNAAVAVLARGIGKSLAATNSTVALLTKTTSKTLSAVNSATSTVINGPATLVAVLASNAAIASLTTSFIRALQKIPGFPGVSTVGPRVQSLTSAADKNWVGHIAQKINQLNTGKMNVNLQISLAANADSTTITDARIGPFSGILLQPLTSDAVTALTTSPYVLTANQSSGSVDLQHANNALTSRNFNLVIIG